MINIDKFSSEVLRKIQDVLGIILTHLEMPGTYNELTQTTKIPLKRFEDKNLDYSEVIGIIDSLDNETIDQLNESIKEDVSSLVKTNYITNRYAELAILRGLTNPDDYFRYKGISEEDLKKYIILEIRDLDKLKAVKEKVDKKLGEIAKTRVVEIKRQFEELDEKQEQEKESLILKEIKERVKKHEERKVLKEEVKKEIIEELKEKDKRKTMAIPKTFEIQVRDRYIWINNYLLSKPHAVGSNLEFFEYIRSQPKNIKIERNKLPDFGGSCLKKDIQNKGFIKILNELGFKGEILKAYFPKRGKNMLIYRGDKITKKDLEKAGVKMTLFLKELELAHIKNSPE